MQIEAKTYNKCQTTATNVNLFQKATFMNKLVASSVAFKTYHTEYNPTLLSDLNVFV